MSKDFTVIPLVDASGLREGGAARRAVVEALGRAAREVGFVYVAGHGVPQSLFDGLQAAAQAFFARPVAEKMEVYIGRSTNHRGYVPEGEEVMSGKSKDRKEAYDLSIDLPADDAAYLAGNPLLGPNQWPALPGFREAVGAYYDAAFGFGRLLLGAFAEAMGEAPELFEPRLKRPPSQLRMIHYPYDPAAQDAMGIGAHTDYELFTLLHSTKPGLEVMNGAGDWIDAPPVPGAYVVNIGDMLELFTNGEFVATSHRVRKVGDERYSFPLFFTLDYDSLVEPLPRFVTPQNPARPGLVAGEHLFAQTAQTFRYLKDRVASGAISLPDSYVGLSSFGQEARRKQPVS